MAIYENYVVEALIVSKHWIFYISEPAKPKTSLISKRLCFKLLLQLKTTYEFAVDKIQFL